jgi:transposase
VCRSNGIAKLNCLNPQAYLADILDRIHDHKMNRLYELLPWNWTSMAVQNSQAA